MPHTTTHKEITPEERVVSAESASQELLGRSLTEEERLRVTATDELRKEAEATADRTAPTADAFISSSAPVIEEEKRTVTDVQAITPPPVAPGVDAAITASQQFTAEIDADIARLETRRKEEVAAIEQSFEARKEGVKGEQVRETGATAATLARIGGFLGPSGSGTGVLLNLAESHRGEVTTLESKKAEAIRQANNAIEDKQFALARLRVQEVKDIEQTIHDRKTQFFNESLRLQKENRAQETQDRQRRQAEFKESMDVIDQVGPTILESIRDVESEQEAADIILSFARDLGVDPDLLLGEINQIRLDDREKERKEVLSLGKKYPSADITSEDTFETASEKVRNSKEYQLDIEKAEADLANVRSLVAGRDDVNFSDPILSLYTEITGNVVASPGKARGILSYADNLLAEKEVVSDDFVGPLLDNQIHASDAQKLISDGFTKLRGKEETGVDESVVWQWLSTDEAIAMTDEQKRTFIMGSGHNPEDFGIF